MVSRTFCSPWTDSTTTARRFRGFKTGNECNGSAQHEQGLPGPDLSSPSLSQQREEGARGEMAEIGIRKRLGGHFPPCRSTETAAAPKAMAIRTAPHRTSRARSGWSDSRQLGGRSDVVGGRDLLVSCRQGLDQFSFRMHDLKSVCLVE